MAGADNAGGDAASGALRFQVVYASFEEVAALDDADVVALLEGGDQTERVWAAWVVGLRAAGESRAELLDRLDGEPTRGVRQHMIVVLAGINAVEPIAAIAASDPSPEVRATASRLAARLVGPERPAIGERLAARFEREPALEVKAALLSEIRADAPAALAALVRRSIRDDRLELRAAASRSALRWSPDTMPAELREPALLEPDAELGAELLAAWIGRAGVADVLEALDRHESAIVARNLRRAGAIERLGWSAVSRFADRGDAVTSALLDAVADLDAAGWRWLLGIVSVADADSRSLQVLDDPLRARAIARMRELSPNPAGSSLSYVDGDFMVAVERLIAEAEAEAAAGGGERALAQRQGRGWWGLRIVCDSGTWLELARRAYPAAIEAELVMHELGDDPWVVSYQRGDRAHLLMYSGERIDTMELGSGSPLDADYRRFCAEASGCEIRVDRESDL